MRFFALPRLRLVALSAAALLTLSPSAQAIDLLSGLGGTSGFGDLAMTPNDDDSSSLLNLPFNINFFGSSYSQFYVNNNGNITFQTALGNFTPDPFPVANQPMIAPWWADVDTRIPGTGGGTASEAAAMITPAAASVAGVGNSVYVGAPNDQTVVVTWDRVGYFPAQTDKTNSFQLVLRNRADTGAGNFDIDFRYQQLQWTTGDASGGTGGLGGTPAQAGYDDGKGTNFYTLPGSRTAEVLNLANTSNVNEGTPGLWTFAVRNGNTPGSEPSNPLMPVATEAGFAFDFNVQANTRVFIDPEVAVGYDYTITGGAAGQSFASVLISTNVGDGQYSLWLWDGSSFVQTAMLGTNEAYDFGVGGVTRFSIRGIETTANLDPNNPTAFVTGLTFTQTGAVSMTQLPITVTAVPEPEPAAMMLLGLGVLGAWTRRSKRAAAIAAA